MISNNIKTGDILIDIHHEDEVVLYYVINDKINDNNKIFELIPLSIDSIYFGTSLKVRYDLNHSKFFKKL